MVGALALRIEAYAKLSQEDRASIDRLSRRNVREVPPRRDVLREGDAPRSLLVLLEGWACRYKTLPDGRRQIVDLLLPGDIFDPNIFILGKMDHSVAAITPLKLAEIGQGDFQRLMAEHPRIAQALSWNELVTVSIQREWTLNVGQRTAYERLSHFLCEMFFRLRAVGLTSGNSCDFPLTQTDLADTTGLTAVHVNRTLQDLRRDGLVELQARKLTIPNLQALMRAGTFNPNYLHFGHEGSHLDARD